MDPHSATERRSFTWVKFKPGVDLIAVLVSYLLVIAGLYVATFVVTARNGVGYFLVYGIVVAFIFGIGIPTFWTVIKKGRPISDLGITTERLGLSLVLQLVFAAVQFSQTLATIVLPAFTSLAPLTALALAIGFFEAVFWRGWVLQRLEDSFGVVPAVLLGSAMYALYHIGYGMPASEILFLFWIGVLYAVVFLITRNVFILWPLLQPLGQLVTLTKDGLDLPMIASLGFIEVLIAMLVLVWLADRYHKKRAARAVVEEPSPAQ